VNLFLIRHAEALPRAENGVPDEERPLTDKGRAQARRVAEALHKQGIQLDVLVTSPLVRAQQTAEEIRAHWPAPAPEVVICEELAPGVRHKKLARWLLGAGEENVALVGHEPDLSDFIGWLIGSKRARIVLRKGSVAAVTCESDPVKGGATLAWLVTQRWLGQLSELVSR
jgi:phosphohistidine phosphatase